MDIREALIASEAFGGGASPERIAEAVEAYMEEHPVVPYVLPIAGDSLGGVKNGGNVTVNADGTISVPTYNGGVE